MRYKEKLRKKFIFLRRKKYFYVNKDFFKPLIKILIKKKVRNIALYYPSNYEVNTLNLFKILQNKNFFIFLPKLFLNRRMKFLRWNYLDPLEINKYGFLEPLSKSKEIIPEIIIVPLVAFDKYHNRLGYGKGYYDRYLSRLIRSKKSVLTIGLAFSFQKYKKIPTIKSDIKLDYILTEKGIF